MWSPLSTDFGGFGRQVWKQVGAKLATKSELSWLSWLCYLILSYLIFTKPNIGGSELRFGLARVGAKATNEGIPTRGLPRSMFEPNMTPGALPRESSEAIVG